MLPCPSTGQSYHPLVTSSPCKPHQRPSSTSQKLAAGSLSAMAGSNMDHCVDKGTAWDGTPKGAEKKVGGVEAYFAEPAAPSSKAVLLLSGQHSRPKRAAVTAKLQHN